MPHFDLAHMHISGLLERLPYNIYGKKIVISNRFSTDHATPKATPMLYLLLIVSTNLEGVTNL